ncbi:MAG: hypothetical protein WC775_03740 [Patescibacteria group bacterium]|jgi:UDP-2,3-diacylglucosamine pyrophosphatase LpxH
MKTVIFSDTHLTHKFDQRTFDYLVRIIHPADRVIINGDFWDADTTTFDMFINSQWKQLFPLLIEKKTLYLYGNHDAQKFADSRVNYFSVEQKKQYSMRVGKHVLRIEHGDLIVPLGPDVPYPTNAVNYWYNRLYGFVEHVGSKVLGRHFFIPYQFLFSHKAKKWTIANLDKDEILIMGHLHRAEHVPEKYYINHGIIRHGIGQYVLIEDEKLELVNEQY